MTKTKDPRRRHVGWRLSEDVRRGVKIAAALDGETVESLAEQMLSRELRRRRLLKGAGSNCTIRDVPH